MVFDASKDLKFDRNVKALRSELTHNRGTFAFDPSDFNGQSQNFTIEGYRLTEEGLKEYGKLATQLRRRFQEKADSVVTAAREENKYPVPCIDSCIPKLSRG